jgi:hypothetical protein
MAKPVEFVGSNVKLGAPPGRDDISELHTYTNGTVSVSCWEFTKDEIVEIVATGRLYVSCFSGRSQPPVYLGTRDDVRSMIADYGGTFGPGDR